MYLKCKPIEISPVKVTKVSNGGTTTSAVSTSLVSSFPGDYKTFTSNDFAVMPQATTSLAYMTPYGSSGFDPAKTYTPSSGSLSHRSPSYPNKNNSNNVGFKYLQAFLFTNYTTRVKVGTTSSSGATQQTWNIASIAPRDYKRLTSANFAFDNLHVQRAGSGTVNTMTCTYNPETGILTTQFPKYKYGSYTYFGYGDIYLYY